MFGFYALVMAAVLAAFAGVLLDCPWLASFATGLLLVLVFVYALLGVIGAAILEVGSDGCVHKPQKQNERLNNDFAWASYARC